MALVNRTPPGCLAASPRRRSRWALLVGNLPLFLSALQTTYRLFFLECQRGFEITRCVTASFIPMGMKEGGSMGPAQPEKCRGHPLGRTKARHAPAEE